MEHVDRAVTAADHEKIAIDQLRGVLDTTALPAVARVVVDLDLDERGVSAMRWASVLAGELSVPITAWVMVGNRSAERSLEIERMFEADTAAAAHRWLDAQDVVVDQLHIASGRRNDDLVASVATGDVIVLGVDPTEGFSEWALGSHAHELVHALHCPLVIVPPGGPAADDAPIVVGIDGTDSNGRVLEWARCLARDLHRDLVPVFAYNALYDTFDNADSVGQSADGGSPDATSIDERPGRPARVLTDVSVDTGAYLTVVGARSEHALRGLLVGRVADHLLHHAPCPVAIISYGAMHGVATETTAS